MSAEASLLIKSNREKQKITKLELGVAEPKRVSESDDSTTTGKLKELSIQLRNSGINEEERLAIYNELTSILWSEGRYEEAKICLDICQSIAPDNLDIQDQIKDLNEETIPSEYVMEGLEEEQKNFVRRQKNYLRYPEVVQIETLAVCNAGCSFCPYPTMERKGDKMAIELFDKIILDLKTQIPKEHEFSIGLNHINEPLADSRWSTFVAKIEDDLPNARVTIITNGYLLHAKNIERLMSFSNISSIQVSLNEINKQKHEQKMHMRGKFEQIVSNLDNLHAALLGSDKELPIYLRRVGDYTENDQEFISYCSKRWPKFHVASRGLKDFLGQVDLKELSSETGKNLHNDEVPIIGCSQWYHIVISASGKVATCCFDGNVDWPIGDVNQTSVLDIYHSESLSRLRDVTKTRLEANSPCNTCNIHWGSGQKNAVYNYKP
jgi:radical SAM protein with 4Fe4S-binding SPASM domain